MKRLLKILFAAVVLIAITLGSILIPKLRNMPSEYAMADTIYRLGKFARDLDMELSEAGKSD
ncbi:hypothetical protein OKA04_11125 [Luteolibacter flavescens]|uniref:Uncharacterized protein n=1 Tax=Luteolibacter flavescens TaxID=1859460 RepID=A0ABT3FNZ1_9BACT|nr:hypothetical protein [Luteolibacter flavescens]MCW1885282.1 hypothetical protein [Luteolibacter flavescens]